MTGAQYFTTLNASNAFWLIKVDEESSTPLTFNTPCGRFKYLRIPYGIHSASKVCQAPIATIIEPIEGCRDAMDDIIFWADTSELLETRTIKVLQAIRQLNQFKFQFNLTELTYLGHSIQQENDTRYKENKGHYKYA